MNIEVHNVKRWCGSADTSLSYKRAKRTRCDQFGHRPVNDSWMLFLEKFVSASKRTLFSEEHYFLRKNKNNLT